MSVHTFRAHCAKGHDRIEFEGEAGAKAFEAHVKAEHGARKMLPGQSRFPGERVAPGWARGEIEKPYPWVAPRPAPGGLAKVMERIAAGEYDTHVFDPEASKLEQRRIVRHITVEAEELAS